MTKRSSYREELIQWIWQQVEFDCRNLETTSGDSLKIIDVGSKNVGAGPDFLGAQLRIGKRDWHGSVEIHNQANEWYQHKHHTDKEFNSVVLHVVLEDAGASTILTQDRFEPFTLVLRPYLTKKVSRLLQKKQASGLACSGNISFINQEAFEQQVEMAHKEYLEYKVKELLNYYDPNLPISRAWKQCLITGIYNTLGIPSNRSQMVELAQKLFELNIEKDHLSSFSEEIESIAFQSSHQFQWKKSGMRPASRPEVRVKQASAFHYSINKLSFTDFFKNDLRDNWNQILSGIDTSVQPGKSRLSLVQRIVYLPAIYLLGDLLQSSKLKTAAFTAWSASNQHLPAEIKTPFTRAGFKMNSSTKKIGLAHLYKRYCLERNCHRCEVFKKAIRS